MIKENIKIDRFNKKKTSKQIIFEYLRTFLVSLCVAVLIIIFMSIHARNEMIKNLYAANTVDPSLDEKVALQIVTESDIAKDLKSKSYKVCMEVGNLYELAHQYEKAQEAYEYAVQKSTYGNYTCYYKLVSVLIAQEKFDEAKNILSSIKDIKNKRLIKFKTRSFIEMGDKYYSIGKFLSAAKSYENAKFYYDKFAKKDKVIDKSILERIINSYVETADVVVKNGYSSDAIRFLQKAEKYDKDNFNIRYKLAIIYADFDPEKSVEYFENLLEKKPHQIDNGVYTRALMKAANIKDLKGEHTKAKYYRYKIHSMDIFLDNKVVFKNDVEVILDKFIIRKFWLKYHLKPSYRLMNQSYKDIKELYVDFVLRKGDKIVETITVQAVNRKYPLYSNGALTDAINIDFGKNIYTKQELNQYYIDIYLYKDPKYKTLVNVMKIPHKSLYN